MFDFGNSRVEIGDLCYASVKVVGNLYAPLEGIDELLVRFNNDLIVVDDEVPINAFGYEDADAFRLGDDVIFVYRELSIVSEDLSDRILVTYIPVELRKQRLEN